MQHALRGRVHWAVWGTVVLAVGLSACAGYSVQEGGQGQGYDVYRPEPYLKRTPLVEGGQIIGYSFDVIYLPNYSKRYRVRSWTGFGASDIQFTFDGGWKLTGLHDQNDNTDVLSELTSLTKHLIPSNPFDIAQAGGGDPSVTSRLLAQQQRMAEESMSPVLYRIVYDDCGRPTCELVKLDAKPCAP